MASSDSESEDLIGYGTPILADKDKKDKDTIEESVTKKPIRVEDQIVTDEKGRRRFHGAFTGGFSAGYFNSVGTPEGWTPATFVSSRKSKADSRKQIPEQFMDDEDLDEFGISARRMHVTSKFAQEQQKKTTTSESKSAIPGVPLLQQLVLPVSNSIGVRILQHLGWRPGQGIGPRVKRRKKPKTDEKENPPEAVSTQANLNSDGKKLYGCALPPGFKTKTDSDSEDEHLKEITFAPEDLETVEFPPKENLFGIGYSGMDRSVKSTQKHASLVDHSKKLNIRGEAFGVGAFETEDASIYTVDDMSQYDFELGPPSATKEDKKPKSHSSSALEALSGFVAAKKPHLERLTFPLPKLPPSYDPEDFWKKRNFFSCLSKSGSLTAGKQFSAGERSILLGENNRSHRRFVESTTENLKQFSRSTGSSAETGQSDADLKRKRSSRWDRHKEKSEATEFQRLTSKPEAVTESETSVESAVQKKAWKEWQSNLSGAAVQLLLTKARQFTKSEKNDKDELPIKGPVAEPTPPPKKEPPIPEKPFQASRKSFEWHPDKLLCRRFNIKDPFPDSQLVGVIRQDKAANSSAIWNYIDSLKVDEEKSAPRELVPPKSSKRSAESVFKAVDKLDKPPDDITMRESESSPEPRKPSELSSYNPSKSNSDSSSSREPQPRRRERTPEIQPGPSRSTHRSFSKDEDKVGSTDMFLKPLAKVDLAQLIFGDSDSDSD